jgi:hypothetical protein
MHSPDISEQVKANFLDRLKRVDSLLVVDSFRIVAAEPMVQKIEGIIDESSYQRILSGVQLQLANAVRQQKRDSMIFYQDEVNYMIPIIDSMRRSISTADTTKIFGRLLICSFQIRRNNAAAKGYAYYFFNDKMNLIFSDRIDSSISQTYRELRWRH